MGGKKIVYDKYGNEKRSCTGSDKNYEDLSDEQIDNLQKVEGLNKGHLKKLYKEIEDSRSQAEDSREDTPDDEESDGRGASIAGSISSAELPLYSYSEEERMKEEEERKRKKKLQSPSSEKESDQNQTKSDEELAEEEKEDFAEFADLPLF